MMMRDLTLDHLPDQLRALLTQADPAQIRRLLHDIAAPPLPTGKERHDEQ